MGLCCHGMEASVSLRGLDGIHPNPRECGHGHGHHPCSFGSVLGVHRNDTIHEDVMQGLERWWSELVVSTP